MSSHSGRCWFDAGNPVCIWSQCDKPNPNYDADRNPDPQYRPGVQR